MTTVLDVKLEIDYERGVIYAHLPSHSILRICRLSIPKHFDPQLDQIDITHMVGASYGSTR